MRAGPVTVCAITVAAAAWLVGCVGYQLGTSLPPNVRTIHVPVFQNKTEEPNIEFDTTQAAVREFQRDGTLSLAAAEEADLVLTMVLTDYELQPLRYREDRATTANEYRMTLTALMTVTYQTTGETMYKDCPVTGECTFTTEADLTEAKTEALPTAARDLAHQTVKRIVEYW